ncbi:hypothetical protein GCM10023185_12840 [Hymenobacter saemangeumensis]|uniref:T9SS type A sorting domain-containing protein n=1 Tax=Hymenobacter saemangeumensis TaxID=1084522 RepID=A0ABP8I771_9BACT
MKKLFTHSLLLAITSGAAWVAPAQAQKVSAPADASAANKSTAPWAALNGRPEDVRVTSSYTDEASGLNLVYVEQLYRGIPIYNHDLTLAYSGTRLVHKAGTMVAHERLANLPATPAVAAASAVLTAVRPWMKAGVAAPQARSAATGVEAKQTFTAPGISRRDIEARLVWATDKQNRLHLAWNVNVELLGSSDWLNIRVDAATGSIIGQDNWTVHEAPMALKRHAVLGRKTGAYAPAASAAVARPSSTTAVTTSAQYLVIPYPKENPIGTSFQTETNPWTRAGANNNATTHGWHFDGTTTFANTRGNNVNAYTDLGGTDPTSPTTYAPSTTAVPSLTFSYPRDFNVSPTSTADNRNNAVTNLFYWNNIIHDVLYQYGFNEASGNFQVTNLGRGGSSGADAVRAEALDGSGTNNANMSTPADGSAPRMQMFLWDGPPTTRVNSPSGIAGDYYSVESSFSTANKLINVGPKTGALQYYNDATGGTHEACTANTANVLTGKIAVIYRGNCGFTVKVKEAQNRGAIAVLMINNQPGEPIGMGGTDNTITIPAVMISQDNGVIITNAMASGTVNVTLLATPPIDGNLDNGVITHEYGHGVSSRLTGGPAQAGCLGNAEQGGEGWSDYLGLMLTTDWTTAQLTDGPNRRGIGNFDVGLPADGPGIRAYPYSTSMTVNPLTYASVSSSAGVHANGTVWCSALWDMTWNIIQQEGSITGNLYNSAATGGNIMALQLVMLGMKLQPCQPGFLNARDAILAADDALYQGRHRCSIWRAFARRGMGVSAVQGASTNADDQTAAYDVPSGVQLEKATEPLAGNTFNITLKATCNCDAPLNNYRLTDVLPTGLQYVSSSGGTLSGNTVTFADLGFTTANETRTFTIQARAASGAACAQTFPVNDTREGTPTGGFASSATSGQVTPWAPSTTRYYSPGSAWSITGGARTSDVTLTSAAFTPTPASILSFYHYFDYEAGYDGGNVEISTNNGTSWTDAGSYFLQNGYNSSTANGACFTGASANGSAPADFIKSNINLSSFAGSSVRVRFRSRSDNSVASVGWTVDNILVTNGCGGSQLVRLYDPANNVVSTTSLVTFLTPAPLPVSLLRFDARWKAAGTELSWATASEKNADRFVVERSLDGSTWAEVGSVAAAGNSARALDYRFVDADALRLPAGMLYYRLRQLDFDGTAALSPVRLVTRPAGAGLLQLTAHPNPVGSKALHLTLQAPDAQETATLRLFDATGRVLWQEKVTLVGGTATLDCPKVAQLPAGLYLVKAELSNGSTSTVRVVRE